MVIDDLPGRDGLPAVGQLREREVNVLRMAATGAEPREISGHDVPLPGTVRNHLTSSVVKLPARNRIDGVRIAHGAGWIP
ncbi:LuxR C-terminal-related transcriptional regulator [Actinacidiphila paucisporea]|uniref:Two-component system, NarL family, response regulator DesR n=1 Tax=Actinacidiphila paucisporea TaxID=310782 RepID=A0A1M7NS24_9ACTN|nr:LuxR C-terminal-related transcriptional regulator [Actinacidiphila paucisporea]SHN06665.1 two-component system, NarL family, response regulator DesR [Actinacidiphila paucisporea]